MRSFLYIFLCAFIVLTTAAITSGEGQQFIFGGIGAVNDCCSTLNAGWGGEYMLANRVGIGGRISYLGPIEDLGEGFGDLDVSGSYHFKKHRTKWDPFVDGGYTLFFREGTANLFHFGGGVQRWMDNGHAVRFEFIDRVWSDYGSYHYYSFLVGFTF